MSFGSWEQANAKLYQQILERNKIFIDALSSLQELPKIKPFVAIVPGAFYREYKNTGADGERIARALEEVGFSSKVIPLASFSSLEVNAQKILDWLAACPYNEILLISLSRGSADVKYALRNSTGFNKVIAWINISGILDGTPIVERVLANPIRRFFIKLIFRLRGYDFSALKELSDKGWGRLSYKLHLPSHLTAVHVLAFPNTRSLSSRLSRKSVRYLSDLGASDGGGILLEKALNWPGFIYPISDTDHYMSEVEIIPLIEQIACFITSQSQTQERSNQKKVFQ